jgi:hypothetical protein
LQCDKCARSPIAGAPLGGLVRRPAIVRSPPRTRRSIVNAIAPVDSPPAAFDFDYRLTGVGWAEATIADETSSATLTASYLGDALGDLLSALGALLGGADTARCSWWEEPGEYRWVFDRDQETVRLRILSFDDTWSHEPDKAGTVVFETRQALEALSRAVAVAAAKVLARHGKAGYRARWVENPFPFAELTNLHEGLSSRAPR